MLSDRSVIAPQIDSVLCLSICKVSLASLVDLHRISLFFSLGGDPERELLGFFLIVVLSAMYYCITNHCFIQVPLLLVSL